MFFKKMKNLERFYESPAEKGNFSVLNCTLVYRVAPEPGCVVDTTTDEFIVGFVVFCIIVYTFYRLYYVWATKLNFMEVVQFLFYSDLERICTTDVIKSSQLDALL